jgi:hypothetical protein
MIGFRARKKKGGEIEAGWSAGAAALATGTGGDPRKG